MDEKVIERNLSMNETEENEVIVESVKHYEDKNYVELEGVLMNRYDLPSVTLLTILTSTGRRKEQTSDIVVVASGDAKEQAACYEKKQRLKIVGEVRTVLRENGDKKVARCEVVAKSIEPAKSGMEEEFGLSGRIYNQSYNKVFLTGTVFRCTQVNRATARVVLQIKTAARPRYVETVVYAKNMKKLAPHLIVGNRICMLCELQSTKKEKEEEKPEYFKNLVVLDLEEV